MIKLICLIVLLLTFFNISFILAVFLFYLRIEPRQKIPEGHMKLEQNNLAMVLSSRRGISKRGVSTC